MNQRDNEKETRDLEQRLRAHYNTETKEAVDRSTAWWSSVMANDVKRDERGEKGGGWFGRRFFGVSPVPVGAALALMLVVGGASLWAAGQFRGAEPSNPDMTLRQGPDGTESISPGGATTLGSCVEVYSPEALRNRAFAFDGTVKSIETRKDPHLPEGDQEEGWVTFTVNQWFKGGEGAEVGVWLGATAVDDGTPVAPGSRLLVTGEPRWGGQPLDNPIAWVGCGFTQGHNPDVAADWAKTLAE